MMKSLVVSASLMLALVPAAFADTCNVTIDPSGNVVSDCTVVTGLTINGPSGTTTTDDGSDPSANSTSTLCSIFGIGC